MSITGDEIVAEATKLVQAIPHLTTLEALGVLGCLAEGLFRMVPQERRNGMVRSWHATLVKALREN